MTAEEIAFDPNGQITHTSWYSHLHYAAFCPGCAFMRSVQTTLADPFEIEVEYRDPTCLIQRILLYKRIADDPDLNWAVHRIVDPLAMKTPPSP